MPIATRLSSQDLSLPNRDGEEIIVIDSDLRNIRVPNSLRTIGVAGDHNAESIFFQIPRYFDGVDLSQHSCVIRYVNAGKEYGEYKVVDSATDDDFIVFGWQISNYVTRYAGTVRFTVQFETIGIDGVSYQWQTVPVQLTVLAALPIEETISDKDDSAFRRLSDEVAALQYRLDSMGDYSSLKEQVANNTKKIKFLEDNVVYTLSNI